MLSDFEEPEFRGILFNQIEGGHHILWEPGQVFEECIGIDRASYCLHDYLWKLHGFQNSLGGSILRGRRYRYIWSKKQPKKLLPDFKLNLFIQVKRASYSSRGNTKLRPHINGSYWHFEITPHQQLALELLEAELAGEALVVYAAPAFHKQQDLYNHTSNRTAVENSSFPKVSILKGHSKWYYDRPGIVGVANPDIDFVSEESLFDQIQDKRKEFGGFNEEYRNNNLLKMSNAINAVVEKRSSDYEATRFAHYNNLIDDYIEIYNIVDSKHSKELRAFMQIETFAYLWKLNWLTF